MGFVLFIGIVFPFFMYESAHDNLFGPETNVLASGEYQHFEATWTPKRVLEAPFFVEDTSFFAVLKESHGLCVPLEQKSLFFGLERTPTIKLPF